MYVWLTDTGVTVNACHPGVARTDIHRYMPIKTSGVSHHHSRILTLIRIIIYLMVIVLYLLVLGSIKTVRLTLEKFKYNHWPMNAGLWW